MVSTAIKKGRNVLAFEQVNFHYQSRRLFQQMTLQLAQPRLVITGPNGCGKTTLLMLAAGLLTPQSGRVTLGQHVVTEPSSKKHIGITASKIQVPDFLTVDALLAFHAKQFGMRNSQDWLSRFGIEKFRYTKVSNLSLGNQKKLSLITAFMHQPELLLLDEPTNGLDESGLSVLAELIEQHDGQVIMASHDVNSPFLSAFEALAMTDLVSQA